MGQHLRLEDFIVGHEPRIYQESSDLPADKLREFPLLFDKSTVFAVIHLAIHTPFTIVYLICFPYLSPLHSSPL